MLTCHCGMIVVRSRVIRGGFPLVSQPIKVVIRSLFIAAQAILEITVSWTGICE